MGSASRAWPVEQERQEAQRREAERRRWEVHLEMQRLERLSCGPTKGWSWVAMAWSELLSGGRINAILFDIEYHLSNYFS